MNITKKIALVVGMLLQAPTVIHAIDASASSNWANAFLAFGGGTDVAQAALNVKNNANSLTFVNAYKIAKGVGTEEAMAIGRYRSQDHKAQFVCPNYQDVDVIAAANALIGASPSLAPNAPVATNPSTSGSSWSWLTGSSSGSSASVQSAVAAQQQADVAAATANSSTLQAIVTSGKTGISLYTAYIDVIFSLFQQAINAIGDATTQQAVVQYAQTKFANVSASASANSYSSRVTGRLSSKKSNKKVKTQK